MVRYIGIMLSALISSCDAKALLGWSLSDKTYFWREGEKSSQSWNTNNTHTHTCGCVVCLTFEKHTPGRRRRSVSRCAMKCQDHTAACLSAVRLSFPLCSGLDLQVHSGMLVLLQCFRAWWCKKKKKMCDWLHFNKLQRQRTLCQHIYFRIHPYGNQPKWHYFDAGQNNVPTERFAKSKTGVTDLCRGDHRKVFSAAAIINIWLWLTITLKDKCVAFLD